MLNWFYKRIRTEIKYTTDIVVKVIYVDVNKPESFIIGDDKTTVEGLAQFLTSAGYYVIVRYKQ
jgi:hypothetical protein